MAPSPSSSSLLFTTAGIITGAALASIYYKTKSTKQEKSQTTTTQTTTTTTTTNKDRTQIIQNIGEYLSSNTTTSNNNNTKNKKVCILGGGAFGTSLAYAASRNGYTTSIYCRDETQASTINHHHYNPRYLSDTTLPHEITATTDLKASVEGCTLIVLALPCQKTPEFLRENREVIPGGVVICVTAKGLYLPTRQLIGDAIHDALSNDGKGGEGKSRKANPLAFFSGPTFASEIVKNNPTVAVVASQTLYHAVHVQKILSNDVNFRLYVSQDIVSVQLGGALKNPLAVGAGLLTGCGYGINTLSAYVTRATGELRQLCVALGGEADTINGLSGVGDLMLTCFSTQSRNQRCGVRLARGECIEDILRDGSTVEGVPTATVAVLYADACGLDMPLFRAVAGVIEGKLKCEEALKRLFERPVGLEMKKK